MIGVDSNVLLRLIVADDQHQHALALEYFDHRTASDPAYISEVVLAETIWVLIRHYGYEQGAVRQIFRDFLDVLDMEFARSDLLRRAFDRAAKEPKADLADMIIVTLAQNVGCSAVVTFDGKAARLIDEMTLLA